MSSLINLRGISNKTINVIRSPVTEMICAFIIEVSRNYIFAFVYQFTGDQLIYSIFQISLIFIPWIMLGHGALRYPQNTDNIYSDLNNYNSSNTLKPKKNLNLFYLLLATFIFIKFLPL